MPNKDRGRGRFGVLLFSMLHEVVIYSFQGVISLFSPQWMHGTFPSPPTSYILRDLQTWAFFSQFNLGVRFYFPNLGVFKKLLFYSITAIEKCIQDQSSDK
jgi:hypothetical protein